MGEMRGIEYFWLKPSSLNDCDSNQFFLNKRVTSSERDNLVDITVFPNEFEYIKCSLVYLRKKWFINLSLVSIPNYVQCFLQLGENFSLPSSYNRKLIFEFIKNVEFNIKKLQTSLHNSNN